MKAIHLLLFYLFFICSYQVSAQESTEINGKIVDAKDNNALAFVNVVVSPSFDSTRKIGAVTNSQGVFSLKVRSGVSFVLKISYIGYETHSSTFKSTGASMNLGTIKLTQSDINLKTAVIEGKLAPVVQKSDTVEFTARSFKVNPDATAEDLVKKMPGITQENGTIKAQGEEVKKVFVDGREFFGDDASSALKNLPAEIIDKVQVFDRMSDQSRFTGFDDGNNQKSLNIITKPGMSNGMFGKFYGGYGTDNHYESGVTVNYFKANRRISLLGMSNNVNQQNFSSQDLMGAFGSTGQSSYGGGGRRGGMSSSSGSDPSNFMTGQQSGINTTTSTGINYTDVWRKKINVQASYFFNQSENNYSNLLSRQYFKTDGAVQLYKEDLNKITQNLNHRGSLRFEYNMDSSNSFILNSKISFQNTGLNSNLTGINLLSELAISNSSTLNINDGNAYSLNNSLLWNHKFKKTGRTLSTQISNDMKNNISDGSLLSANSYLWGTDIIDQINNQLSDGNTSTLNISYTEPIGKFSQLQFTYNPSVNINSSEKNTFNFDTISDSHSMIDSSLSSQFDNDIITQRGGVNYRIKKEKFTLSVGANYQQVKLTALQLFPNNLKVEAPFVNVLPMGMLMYQIGKSKSLRVFTRAFTQTPQLSQLQNVLNNSNPLQLSIGNPNLDQQTTYMLGGRFNATNSDKSTSFMTYVHGQVANNYLGNSSYLASADSTEAAGFLLSKGTQLTIPVNLNGYVNLRTFFTYARPIKSIKSNVNVNWGGTYIRIPGRINEVNSISNTYNANVGFLLGSNISKELDFTLSYSANYNWVFNTLLTSQNNNYLTHAGTFKFNWMPWKGLVITSDLNHSSYFGLGNGFNQQIWLLNAGVGYKFLKNRQAEIRLIAFDILKQNKSINRVVYETYIEDTNTSVLQQYFMLTFVYNIRNFGMAKTPAAK